MEDFAVKHMQHPKAERITPKFRQWLCRCRSLAVGMGRGRLRGKLDRDRLHGGGRCPNAELEYALFSWYVDMMGAVTTRIWPSTLRAAAKVICGKLNDIARAAGKPPPKLPQITPQWVWLFMRKYRIVWRKSNVVYKVSRAKCRRRSKRTWLQSCKVRKGLELLHGTPNGRQQS